MNYGNIKECDIDVYKRQALDIVSVVKKTTIFCA